MIENDDPGLRDRIPAGIDVAELRRAIQERPEALLPIIRLVDPRAREVRRALIRMLPESDRTQGAIPGDLWEHAEDELLRQRDHEILIEEPEQQQDGAVVEENDNVSRFLCLIHIVDGRSMA